MDTVRYPIETTADHRVRLNELAKKHKLTQGELIQVMIDTFDPEAALPIMEAVRQAKLQERERAKQLRLKIKSLTPEQLAALDHFAVK